MLRVLVTASLLLIPAAIARAGEPRPCEIRRDGNTLVFRCGGHEVGRYLIDPKQLKPHFHPLHAPNGKAVTRFFPMTLNIAGESRDHPHHVGCWVGHQIVVLERGESGHQPINANFWAIVGPTSRQKQGKQVCTKVEEPRNGPGRASVVTHNDWRTTDGMKILEEMRTLHLADLGAAQLIILDVELHATEGGITFGDEKDGFFAIRVADVMAETRKQGGLLENAEGKKTEGPNENRDRRGCWGLRSDWVDYSGVVEGERVGATLFDHPENPVRACWHARGYGLLSANPFGRIKSKFPDAKENPELVKIPAGGRLRFRYAVLLHPGDAREGKVAEHYQRFVEWK